MSVTRFETLLGFLGSVALLGVAGCASPAVGDKVTVQGRIDTTSGADLANFPGGTLPASVQISVLGRDADEFTVTFDSTSKIPGYFEMSGLPNQKELVFELTTASTPIDPSISFPKVVDPDMGMVLPILSSGLISKINTYVIQPGQVMATKGIDMTFKGMILGAISPKGTGCSPITGVSLVSKADGGAIPQDGPFYFSTTGYPDILPYFHDAECSYVIFNILPGTYILQTLGSGSFRQVDVTVLATKVTVGYGIPGSP